MCQWESLSFMYSRDSNRVRRSTCVCAHAFECSKAGSSKQGFCQCTTPHVSLHRGWKCTHTSKAPFSRLVTVTPHTGVFQTATVYQLHTGNVFKKPGDVQMIVCTMKKKNFIVSVINIYSTMPYLFTVMSLCCMF